MWYNTIMIEDMKMNEYECECGHVWLDDRNYGCPMCGKRNDITRRDYVIAQPESFAHRHEQED